ncbi:hypothetical protein BU24DRAFT_491109 [Aaosphaeria arxii CBS 175.79]|uniref:Large ribosomal subunit protein bL32m n=1 Tax=Aaosphaeria arxii CBS 175.79 TaxID=1450172 RepID=A0A6A5XXK0_9PLEO|nr:uncharacterized protein BU24DRAFT_491109 [Aaosphaeria arxii CBS 175.79]KAF2018065.1 hypothetical protein BU24DRAFT_491109 [Aaosphaeria arxii CBS 175.79]
MALARPLPPLWQTLLPALNGPVRPVINLPLLQRISQPFQLIPTPFAALALPTLSLPSIPSLGEIWEGILRAVPKNKTSYRKKRQRFMAGKGLEELTSLNKCSACGRIKRAHFLCPYCVHSLKNFFFRNSEDPKAWEKYKERHYSLPKKMQKQLHREKIFERRRERSRLPKPETKPGIIGEQKRWTR